MEKQKNIAEFQEKFVVPVPANIAKIVDERDRKILADCYLKLFSGFAWVNWTGGHSLGRAWQTALTQCESFINTKNSNNPALKHLRNVFNSHKKYWSRIIMTHRDSGANIAETANSVAQMRAYGMHLIRQAMDKINLILARYNERIEELGMEQQNAQGYTATYIHTSGTVIHSTSAINTADSKPSQGSEQIEKAQNTGNTNAQPMRANKPATEQSAIAQQANQSQPKQVATQQQAVAQQQQAMAQSTGAKQNAATQSQKQSQQIALAEPVKTPQRAVSANAHKQVLTHATEKLKQLQPAIVKQKESALHNSAAQQVAKPKPYIPVAKPQTQVTKPQLSGLVQNRAQPKPHVASVAKLQSQIATSVPRKPQVQVARPQVQVAKPQTQVTKPQLSGLVQNRAQPKPRVASIANLQSRPNTVAKVPHRINMNMMLFKNFNQRVA